VYALLAGAVIVYIGRTRQPGSRLRTHWKDAEKREAGIDGWEVVTLPAGVDFTKVEADLIFQHQPRVNKVGKNHR
jgi:hypothetical protein